MLNVPVQTWHLVGSVSGRMFSQNMEFYLSFPGHVHSHLSFFCRWSSSKRGAQDAVASSVLRPHQPPDRPSSHQSQQEEAQHGPRGWWAGLWKRPRFENESNVQSASVSVFITAGSQNLMLALLCVPAKTRLKFCARSLFSCLEDLHKGWPGWMGNFLSSLVFI